MHSWVDQSKLAHMTGMVIPAYFSSKPPDDMVRQLLWVTLGDAHHYLPLQNIWVVVDGDARTAALAEQVRERLLQEHGVSFHLLSPPENRGKLWAKKEGITTLLDAKPSIEYIVIRDGDGDHLISDLPPLLRAADHLTRVAGDSKVILIGSRRSRHGPLGWVRGELETLLDKITLDALVHHMARKGQALDLSYSLGQVPDLSSGYKLYGREMAQYLFVEHQPKMMCLSPHDYWHYGPETVTIVEGVLAGALIGEIPRSAWDRQPTTAFGEFPYVPLYGGLLAWVYARLDIPLDVAAQLYDNQVPTMLLRTTDEGRRILAAVREHALQTLKTCLNSPEPTPESRPMLPFL
ncbi:MAG: hypothetical protein A2Y73_01030 [Chloroflexi bacterium RBG_13_56_8]|nr:MAG: hypothetical protein A2Y73_01030 [Chloroflexi bacterium RBG_13_56_8]